MASSALSFSKKDTAFGQMHKVRSRAKKNSEGGPRFCVGADYCVSTVAWERIPTWNLGIDDEVGEIRSYMPISI